MFDCARKPFLMTEGSKKTKNPLPTGRRLSNRITLLPNIISCRMKKRASAGRLQADVLPLV